MAAFEMTAVGLEGCFEAQNEPATVEALAVFLGHSPTRRSAMI